MAIRAIGLEGSKMEIRVSMAGHTLGRKPRKLPVRMATLASHIDMGAIQGKVTTIVVEGCVFPVGRIVTGTTVCAKTAAMLIILAMTGIAIHRRALVNAVLMAFFTGYPGMLSFQFESG
jgi:hypothetical protein